MNPKLLDSIEKLSWTDESSEARPTSGGVKTVGDISRQELEARGKELRRKLVPKLREEFGEDVLKENEFVIIGMPKEKVEGFDLEPTGKIWAAQNPAISEVFAHRAAQGERSDGVGAVVLVFERGTVDLRGTSKPVDDAPQMIEYVLQGEALQRLAQHADVVEMPELFDD